MVIIDLESWSLFYIRLWPENYVCKFFCHDDNDIWRSDSPDWAVSMIMMSLGFHCDCSKMYKVEKLPDSGNYF